MSQNWLLVSRDCNASNTRVGERMHDQGALVVFLHH